MAAAAAASVSRIVSASSSGCRRSTGKPATDDDSVSSYDGDWAGTLATTSHSALGCEACGGCELRGDARGERVLSATRRTDCARRRPPSSSHPNIAAQLGEKSAGHPAQATQQHDRRGVDRHRHEEGRQPGALDRAAAARLEHRVDALRPAHGGTPRASGWNGARLATRSGRRRRSRRRGLEACGVCDARCAIGARSRSSRRLALDSGMRGGRVSLVGSSGGIGVSSKALAGSTCYAYVLYTMVLSSRGIGARLTRQIANR